MRLAGPVEREQRVADAYRASRCLRPGTPPTAAAPPPGLGGDGGVEQQPVRGAKRPQDHPTVAPSVQWSPLDPKAGRGTAAPPHGSVLGCLEVELEEAAEDEADTLLAVDIQEERDVLAELELSLRFEPVVDALALVHVEDVALGDVETNMRPSRNAPVTAIAASAARHACGSCSSRAANGASAASSLAPASTDAVRRRGVGPPDIGCRSA